MSEVDQGGKVGALPLSFERTSALFVQARSVCRSLRPLEHISRDLQREAAR